MSEFIRYSESDGVAEIILDRPAKRNALTHDMFLGLAQAWQQFETGHARVCILGASSDDVFSAGADLNDPPQQFWRGIPEFGFRCEKPTIAAISGKAIGAGLVLGLMCDMVIVTENAQLIYPEAKVGLSGGGASTLVKRGGMRLVMEMLLVGDPISAQRAYEAGMVNRVVPNGQHLEEAREMARKIAVNAPLVVSMLKRFTLEAAGDSEAQTMFQMMARVDGVMTSQDAKDALAAFKEKKQPVFNGR